MTSQGTGGTSRTGTAGTSGRGVDDFRLLMISAMYENGGNVTHRFLDGHPQLHVYPFESQLGTALVVDHLTSLFPVKYRWPVFPLDGDAAGDYHAIIDEEGKVRARTPHVSKFRHVAFEMDDDARGAAFRAHVAKTGRSRGGNVAAFFRATFETWRNAQRTGREVMYVGYSPIVVVDTEKILADLPGAHVLHVVRNPWSAYADHRRRPVPQPLARYLTLWSLNQYFALLFRDMHPGRVHVVRIEDVLADPRGTLGALCETLGLERADALATTTWNGQPLDEVYPWGTIRRATAEANRATAEELSAAEREDVRRRAKPYLEAFGYADFLG